MFFRGDSTCQCGQNLTQAQVHAEHMPPAVVKQHQEAWLASMANRPRYGVASSKRIQEAK
jgi:hypothetical protein